MTFLISGGAKSGKSAFAQSLAMRLSAHCRRYYAATLISTGAEDDERIRRHLADRDGLGFETLDCQRGVLSCLSSAESDSVFLVDSVTSLLQNAIFPPELDYVPQPDAAARCADELAEFARRVRHAIFVSDYIYSDAERYSESTELYRRALAALDRRLASVCDTVIEVSAGLPTVHKGGDV